MKEMINKIFNEDCLETMRRIGDNSIDLILTDPPYGMDFRSNRRRLKYRKIHNDHNVDFIAPWIKEISRITKDDSHLYVFCSHHNIEIFKYEIQKYRNVKNIIIWEKNNSGMGDLQGDYAPKYEFIIFCSNGNKKLNGGRDSNIIKANITQNNFHPTEKPIDLMEYLIEKSTIAEDVVLDTFSGSGSTLVASKQKNRNFIGCEIDKEYFEIAKKRLSKIQMSLF